MNLLLALDSVPTEGTGYVFAAYLFFMAVILLYIAILGLKFQRMNKDLGQLNDELEAGTKKPAAPVAAQAVESAKEPAEVANG